MFRFIPTTILNALAAAALLLASTGPPAGAAPVPMLIPCAERAEVVDILGQQYGEQRHGLGLTLGGQMLEIFVARNGHWSALLSYADGRTCMIAAGEGWLDEPVTADEQS
jgi:hypothetical protein